ncbi:MAG: hypothetical protein ABW139_02870 [Candidatus Thiodiazotropha sp. DIVDIV]
MFFDELGPPWPKHPCTDNSSIPKQIGYNSSRSIQAPSKKYGWQMNGWAPFFITTISRIDNFSQKIIGMLREEEITLYINSIFHHHGKIDIISAECISYARKEGDNKYKISLITTSDDTKEITAFKLLSEARKSPDAKKKPRLHKPKKVSSPGNNAMALAFAAAQKIQDKR